MRIVSFNVENFFARAKALDTDSWATGRPVLEAYEQLNVLLAQPTYTGADKTRIRALLDRLGLTASDSAELAVLRQGRGRLGTRPPDGGLHLLAGGPGGWGGRGALTPPPIPGTAGARTARGLHGPAGGPR